MRFHPRMAPVKAGIFPLVNKEGMPEVAEKLYDELPARAAVPIVDGAARSLAIEQQESVLAESA